MRAPYLLAAILVLAAVFGPLSGLALAQENGTDTGPNTPYPNDTPDAGGGSNGTNLTYETLKQDGPHQSNSPPSVRMGFERLYWVTYWPANNPFANPGSTEGGKFLPANHEVGRNAVWIRTWTWEDYQRTVHLVYWNKGTETVKVGNRTTERTIAENVSHVTHEVTFRRGRPTTKIPLAQHDTPVRVTMWIEGAEWARWTFKHHSVATTQAVSIDSAGDYLTQVIVDFLVWIVLGGFAVGLVAKKALDRAGTGPGYGYTPWVIAITLLTAGGAAFFYQSLADLVVNARIVLSLYVVAIFGVILIETYETGVSSALFFQPTLEHAESPLGEENKAFDIIDGEVTSEKIVRTPGGEPSVVRPGLLPFLARAFGATAVLENASDLRTRFELKNSKWDEMFIADPEADELLHYSPEGWALDLPAATRENLPEYGVVVGGVGVALYALSQGAAPGWAILSVTGLGLAWWLLTPRQGLAAVEPAPIHIRSAFGSMVKLADETDAAKYLDDVKSQRDAERIRKVREVDEEVARHDRTLLEEMLDPKEDVPAGDVENAENELQEQQETAREEWFDEHAANGTDDD